MKMQLLYISHRCPFPPDKGDRIRIFNILKYLSKQYEVKLIYPAFTEKEKNYKHELIRYCRSINCIKMNKAKSILRCIIRLISNDSITSNYFWSRGIKNIVNKEKFDIAVVDCSSMAQYVMENNSKKIIDFIDVDSEKWKLYSKRSSFFKSLIYKNEYIKMKNLENRILKNFDACIVVSEEEKMLLGNGNHTYVVKNGIDTDFFDSKLASQEKKENYVIFTGAMDYFPNIDGVLYFYEEIFPNIKNRVKGLKFVIAGMNPARKITKMASEHVIVTGYVSDIRTYIARASVSVVPLRIAKGIQNKVLEAMAMGTPVVATTSANRGINARDRQEIMIADDPQEFADAVVELLHKKGLREKIAKNAEAFVKNNFEWDNNLKHLIDIISRVQEKDDLKEVVL